MGTSPAPTLARTLGRLEVLMTIDGSSKFALEPPAGGLIHEKPWCYPESAQVAAVGY